VGPVQQDEAMRSELVSSILSQSDAVSTLYSDKKAKSGWGNLTIENALAGEPKKLSVDQTLSIIKKNAQNPNTSTMDLQIINDSLERTVRDLKSSVPDITYLRGGIQGLYNSASIRDKNPG
jgi:hypothetical protein